MFAGAAGRECLCFERHRAIKRRDVVAQLDDRRFTMRQIAEISAGLADLTQCVPDCGKL